MENTLNQRIKILRAALDLSQARFAFRIGLSQGAIFKIESGGDTSSQTLNKICSEFDVNHKWLMDGEGEMFKSTGAIVNSPEKVNPGTQAPSMIQLMQQMVQEFQAMRKENKELKELLLKLSGNRWPLVSKIDTIRLPQVA